MLEAQKDRIYERSRMRAKGASEEEIEAAQNAARHPFRPAFVNGKRRQPEASEGEAAPGWHLASSRQA